MLKFLQTIRMDVSDSFVFEPAAEPGEWAVTGSVSFLGQTPPFVGKHRQAFRNGWLGLGSFGHSTFVSVAEMTEDQCAALTASYAEQLMSQFGAPSAAIAREAAASEIAQSQELAKPLAVNTLLSLEREITEDGLRERFHRLQPKSDGHATLWDVISEAS